MDPMFPLGALELLDIDLALHTPHTELKLLIIHKSEHESNQAKSFLSTAVIFFYDVSTQVRL